jgi:hypothetical protein
VTEQVRVGNVAGRSKQWSAVIVGLLCGVAGVATTLGALAVWLDWVGRTALVAGVVVVAFVGGYLARSWVYRSLRNGAFKSTGSRQPGPFPDDDSVQIAPPNVSRTRRQH